MTPTEAAAAVVARLREADNEGHKAMVAFAAGKFPDYFKAKCAESQKRIDDEYAKLFRPPADG